MSRSFATFVVAGLLLLATACTVGPDYKTPQMDLPAAWQDDSHAVKPDPQILADWWTQFNDPVLDQLIEQAGSANIDLKIALSRVDAYRAALGIANGALLPEVNASASLGRQETSDLGLSQGSNFGQYQIQGALSWELDLFGRLRRTVEAAYADLQASEEMAIDVKTSIYASVASTYFEMRTLQERLRVLEANLKTQEEGLKLAEARLKHGLGSQLEVAQSQSLLQASRAQRPALHAALARVRGALALLLGTAPQNLAPIADGALPQVPADIAFGVPADLLRQRPDIRTAERMLAAQIARVGVAEAARYPNFSLTAVLGLDAIKAGDLFDTDASFWGLTESLSQSIFNGSRLRNRVAVEDARGQEALLNYEQTVLRALEEVHTGGTVFKHQITERQHLQEALQAARTSLKAARSLYKEGLVDFQNVLDAQRQQLAIEDQLVSLHGNHAITLASLYRALGGGWEPSSRDQ